MKTNESKRTFGPGLQRKLGSERIDQSRGWRDKSNAAGLADASLPWRLENQSEFGAPRPVCFEFVYLARSCDWPLLLK